MTNTDGQISTGTVEFWQPKYTSVSPSSLGQGASNIPVTVSGSGFREGSFFTISQFSSSASDVTVGAATVTPTTITAPVSVGTNGGASARTITIQGPDGGTTNGSGFSVTARPTIDEAGFNADSIDPNTIGRGGVVDATVNGSGFTAQSVFSFGDPAITAVTKPGTTATAALITVTVGPTAVLGGHNITVNNPDHGSYTTEGDGSPVAPYPLDITAAPVVTGVSPASSTAGGPSKNITLTGTDFHTSGMTADFGPGITVNSVNVIDATSATVNITIPNGTAAGSRNIVVQNTDDKGKSTCTGCFGVDSLTVVPPTAFANTNDSATITFSAGGKALSSPSSATLHKTGSPAYQPDLAGTAVSTPDTGSTAQATFNLIPGGIPSAPGAYDAIVVNGTGGSAVTYSCTACVTLTGSAVTLTSLAPTSGGQGAQAMPVTLTGTGFARGLQVAISGLTVTDVNVTSPTTATAAVTIPGTATGAKDVTVTNTDGQASPTKTGGFTVNPGPKLQTATPTAFGQGSTSRSISVVGTGFTANSTLSVPGGGVSVATTFVDATHLTGLVTVASDSATGARDLTVTNRKGDQGDYGSDTKTGALTVTAKPTVSLVSPSSLVAGKATRMTIAGQDFQSGALPVIAGVTFANTAVAADGKSLQTDATVSSSAAPGPRAVKVINSDGGSGTCGCSFTVVLPTTLTMANLPYTLTWGQTLVVSGKLANANTGGGIGGATIKMTFYRGVQFGTSVVERTTASNGSYFFSYRPAYTTKVTVAYAGSSTTNAASAPSDLVYVAARVGVSSPVSGATTPATTILTVRGNVAPNKAGKTILLYRQTSSGFVYVAKATIASNSSYAIASKLPKGTYTLRTSIAATPGNAAGYSPTFVAKRS